MTPNNYMSSHAIVVHSLYDDGLFLQRGFVVGGGGGVVDLYVLGGRGGGGGSELSLPKKESPLPRLFISQIEWSIN